MSATDHSVETKQQIQIARPKMYSVVLLNDDFTPMDFVTILLMDVFGMDLSKAERLMLEIHRMGKGVAGTFTREVAETKATMANKWAEKEGHPLLCQVQATS